MIARPITSLARFGAAAALLLLGGVALLQVGPAATAGAAGSSVTIFGWGASPTPAPSLPSGVTPTVVAQGFETGYAIGSDGNAYAWGSDEDGVFGDGMLAASDGVVHVALPSGVSATAIAGGTDNGYAIGSDGNVYAWGWNGEGELGDGSMTGPDMCSSNAVDECAFTPVKVDLPAGVTAKAIATAGDPRPGSAFAIGSDGNLYAWGDNTGGVLGDGTTNSSDTPVVVSLAPDVHPVAIAGGANNGYAIGSDGSLYAWGFNGFGGLGNGTMVSSEVPVKVSMPVGVTPTSITASIANDSGAGYAIGSDGNLYAWGYNGDGELGDGTTAGPDECTNGAVEYACSTTPVRVSLPSGVVPSAIGGNYDGGAAVGSNGKIYSWGRNNLGNGSSGSSSTPVVVALPSGSTPVEIATGASSATQYAIVNAPDVAPAITTQPTSPTVYSGTNASVTAAASGYPVPTVQWQVSTDGGSSFSPVSGATSDTLTISGTTTAENGDEYEAVFTNAAGTATTDPATLTVTPSVAPVVTTDPVSQSVSYGGTLTFSAAASGTPTPAVHWQLSVDGGSSWIDGPQTTADPLTTGTLTSFENGWEVRAVFTNAAGTAISNPATITVTVPPPTTSVSLPSNGATVSGGVWLDSSAQSVVGVKSLSYEVSGGSVSDMVVSAAVDTDVGWLGVWDSTDVANGSYRVQSVVTDNDGNSVTSAAVTVSMDNLPLHSAVLVPSSGATLSGSASVLDASAAGTADITGVQFVVSGGSLSDQVVATAALTIVGWVAEWNTTSVPNGPYVLESVATETGGTTATSPPVDVSVAN